MNHAMRTKSVMLHGPATAATSATASARVDTLGYRWCTIETILTKATATNSSAKWGVLKVTDADTTTYVATNTYVALTGTTNTVTDATNGFVIAAQNNTTDAQVGKIHVDLRGSKKRYLFVVYQAADSHSTVVIKAELSKAETMPDSATEWGAGFVAAG